MQGIIYSFIIPFRNRDLLRVKTSLDSLKLQTIQNFEVIFVNNGSDEKITHEIEQLVNGYSFCCYFYTETRGLFWNKANALNLGLMHAKGDYIIITDIDLIFPGDYLELVTKRIIPGIFLTHRCYYLPKDYSQADLLIKPFSYPNEIIPINFIGLLAVNRESALKINGFDEFYQIWGAEDDDFIVRLEESGLQRRIIDVSEIPIWHQWHPLVSPKKPTPWYLAELNYLYMGAKSKMDDEVQSDTKIHGCDRAQPSSINCFGKIFTIEERPALKAYLKGSYKNSPELKISRNDHLAFLEFYQGFSRLDSGNMCYFEYVNYDSPDKGMMLPIVKGINKILNKLKKFHYRLIREEKIKSLETVKFNDVIDFVEYFIGINRESIEDYYFALSDTRLNLIIKKK